MRRIPTTLFSLTLGLLPLALTTVAACAAQGQSPLATPVVSAGLCAGDGLGRFVGQPATAELGRDILRQTGASSLRWVAEGMMVTMEFRQERVTVHLDRSNRVKRAVCG